MDTLMHIVPVLSLAVAALAVFVGPIISLNVARRQVASSLEVANKQVIAPMRQAWINTLRDQLAELASAALHYNVAGYDERSDAEYMRLTFLEHKVQLMLNLQEDDHQKLEKLIRAMVQSLGDLQEADSVPYIPFKKAHSAVMKLSREVLKREWDRVKEPIAVDRSS